MAKVKSLRMEDDGSGFKNYPSKDEDTLTETQTWKNIIFVPFNKSWETGVILTVVCNSMIILFDFVYTNNTSITHGVIGWLHILCEVVYSVDTVLTIMHKNMPKHRSTRVHCPKNLFLITLDLLTVLPILNIYKLFLLTAHDKTMNKSMHYVRIKSLIRAYRLYIYFHNLRNSAGLNQIVIVWFEHFVLFLLVAQCFGAAWYSLGMWKDMKDTWTKNLSDFMFDWNNPYHWVVICFASVGNFIAQNTIGVIKGENPSERGLIIAALIVGYFTNVIVLFGQMCAVYLKELRKLHSFVAQLEQVKTLLVDWGVPKELQQKVFMYYDELWKKRHGFKDVPPIFYDLPQSLQMEVSMDIFWEALRHSHIFATEDVPFKRALSCRMKSEIYMPGDLLFKINEPKSKMVYIASGIIQVLSDEDDESPLLSLSSGTVIGEVSCFLNGISTVNVRCATYCELHTLSMVDLYKFLWIYTGKTNALLKVALERIDFAKKMQLIAAEELKERKKHSLKVIEESNIKWLKRRWRIMHKWNKFAQSISGEMPDTTINVSHCSRFLDLLVLSDDVELKMKAVCLTKSFPFIMEPQSSFRAFWDYVSLLSILIQASIIPYIVFFVRTFEVSWNQLLLTCDAIYIIDFFIQSTTAERVGNILTSNWGSIIVYRGKKLSFLVDGVCCCNIDYILYFASASLHEVALFKLNRLLKIYKILEFFHAFEKDLRASSWIVRAVKYFFVYLLTTYYFTCLIYAMACFEEDCYSYSWFYYSRLLEVFRIRPEPIALSDFIQSLYTTASTYWGFTASNRCAYIIHEIIVFHVLTITGYFMYLICSSELCSAYILNLEQKIQHTLKIKVIRNSNIFRNGLSSELNARAIQFLEFQKELHKGNWVMSERAILTNASKELYIDLIEDRIIKTMLLVPFFQLYDGIILKRLAGVTIFRTVPPNAFLVQADNKSTWIHVIVRGKCTMTSSMKGDVHRKTETILKEGDAFPLVEVLHNVSIFLTVQAITSVEIICVPQHKFKLIMKSDPELNNELNTALANHMEEDEALLMRKEGKLPPMSLGYATLGHGEMFTYNITDKVKEDFVEKNRFMQPYIQACGRWKFIRFLLLKSTINPTKKKFLVWESGRNILSIIRGFVTLFYFSLFYNFSTLTKNLLAYAFQIIALVDIYVRIHVQYYNENGILITHPLYTARHYLKTSFLIDIITCLPFLLFKTHYIFGEDWGDLAGTLMMFLTRNLQLYRIVPWFNILAEKGGVKTYAVVHTIKFVYLLALLVSALATISQLLVCRYSYNDDLGGIQTKCKTPSWITSSIFKDDSNYKTQILESFFLVLYALSRAGSGIFVPAGSLEISWLMSLFVIGFVLRWYILAKILSLYSGKDTSLLEYRHSLQAFLNFINNEEVDEDLVQKVVDFYEHNWKKNKGINIKQQLSQFHPQLRLECAMKIVYPTLELVSLFKGVDIGFLRHLSVHCASTSIMKDIAIIRCNDIQSKIYIVSKGQVEIRLANSRLCSLGQGGIFGNLTKEPRIRQTITAVAVIHSDLLVINSNVFFRVAMPFHEMKTKLERMIMLRQEYMESTQNILSDNRLKMGSSLRFSKATCRTHCMSIINGTLRENNKFVKVFNYITCMLIAPVSAISFIYLAFVQWYPLTWENGFIYTYDVCFIIRIIIRSRQRYIDHDSGIVVKDIKKIRKRYFKSFRRFGLDLISTIPFELFVGIFYKDKLWKKYFIANRCLRFWYLIEYSHESDEKIERMRHIKWMYLLYIFFIFHCSCSAIWWNTGCIGNTCRYLVNASQVVKVYKPEPDVIGSVLICWLYVTNLFSTTGYREVTPVNTLEFLMTILIIFISQIVFNVLLSDFTSELTVAKYVMSSYEYNIEKLYQYLQTRELSPPILKKVWTYCLETWRRSKGHWLPTFIQEAPTSIKQEVMFSIYGKHLENNFLFSRTHIHFLRQLVTHMKRFVYFPGEYIIEKGDVDSCMYFIHSGEIEVYSKLGQLEVLNKILEANQSFGEAEGLYHYPHSFSYKARTVSDIIVLCRMDWEYLLDYFPASKEEIEMKAEENRIQKPPNITDREKTSSFYLRTPQASGRGLIPMEYMVFN